MKKEDKAIFKGLVLNSVDEKSGCVFAYAEYNVKRLWWMEKDVLEELLFRKTLDAYPFAVINRGLTRGKGGKAYIELYIFIPEGARLRKVGD